MLSILRQRAVKHTLQKIVKVSKRSERSHYYFGYGANLSVKRFKDRQMNVEEIGNAVLMNHEVKFSLSNEYKNKGYAGVHAKQDSEVWGVLYKMDRLSLALLDTLEWCGFGAYERKEVEVFVDSSQKRQKAWCYFVQRPKFDLFPSKIYLNNMIKASHERGFPDSYINFLKAQDYRENFEIDHGFSLLFYGKRRILERKLKPIYKIHDQLREKLCELI